MESLERDYTKSPLSLKKSGDLPQINDTTRGAIHNTLQELTGLEGPPEEQIIERLRRRSTQLELYLNGINSNQAHEYNLSDFTPNEITCIVNNRDKLKANQALQNAFCRGSEQITSIDRSEHVLVYEMTQIGEGSLGKIHEAHYLQGNQLIPAVVKTFFKNSHGELEAANARALIHRSIPHLMKVLFVGSGKDSETKILYEKIEDSRGKAAENLSDAIEARRILPSKIILAHVDVGLALNALHTQGFAHMDVKPINICLGQETTLIDIGSMVHKDEPLEIEADDQSIFTQAIRKKTEKGSYQAIAFSRQYTDVNKIHRAIKQHERDISVADRYALGASLLTCLHDAGIITLPIKNTADGVNVFTFTLDKEYQIPSNMRAKLPGGNMPPSVKRIIQLAHELIDIENTKILRPLAETVEDIRLAAREMQSDTDQYYKLVNQNANNPY